MLQRCPAGASTHEAALAAAASAAAFMARTAPAMTLAPPSGKGAFLAEAADSLR